jgi:hypothetical protein
MNRGNDVAAIRQLVHDAYGHYVARLGKLPGPLLDDYARRIAEGQVWVLGRSFLFLPLRLGRDFNRLHWRSAWCGLLDPEPGDIQGRQEDQGQHRRYG